MSPAQHEQLVSQGQDLQEQAPAGFQPGNGQVKHESQPTNHAAEDSGKYLRSPVFSAWMRFLPTTAPELPPQWAKVEENVAPRCTAKAPQIRSLVETLQAQVPECRSKHALAYPMAGMLALIALAMFSGVRRGPQDLVEYAATLSQGQLRALGFRWEKHTGKFRCPGVTPFRTVLSGVDAGALERALLLWQEQLLGPAQDKLVIVDGKTLRHAHVELVSAVNCQGRWLGTVPVKAGSNEIPAARELLGHLELANKTTLADALHTQVETVQQVIFQGGGD